MEIMGTDWYLGASPQTMDTYACTHTQTHTPFPRTPFPNFKIVHLCLGPRLLPLLKLPHTCGPKHPVGFSLKMNLGHSEGFVCLLARKPAGNLLSSSPPPPLSTERGGPCRSQLNLAWQRARVTRQQGLGQRAAGGQASQWFSLTFILRLARSLRLGKKPQMASLFPGLCPSCIPHSLPAPQSELGPMNATRSCLIEICLH